MKAREYIQTLREQITKIKEIMVSYPDLRIIQDWDGEHFQAKSANKLVMHYKIEGQYLRFYIKHGVNIKIYSQPDNFGCYTDEWYPVFDWIDEAMKAGIVPSILLEACKKLDQNHANSEEFKKKFAEYNDKFW